MSNFIVGDVVERQSGGSRSVRAGERAVVAEVFGPQIRVQGRAAYWEDRYFKLIERAPIGDPDDSKPEATDITPAYYAFPGGIRVHQISGHLTSFGGQALQYIARSTRLDGQNKGDTAENLRKAIRFLTLEIQRIEAEDE